MSDEKPDAFAYQRAAFKRLIANPDVSVNWAKSTGKTAAPVEEGDVLGRDEDGNYFSVLEQINAAMQTTGFAPNTLVLSVFAYDILTGRRKLGRKRFIYERTSLKRRFGRTIRTERSWRWKKRKYR